MRAGACSRDGASDSRRALYEDGHVTTRSSRHCALGARSVARIRLTAGKREVALRGVRRRTKSH